jgi:hypothetical protein
MDALPQRNRTCGFKRYLLTSSNKVQFSSANVNLYSSLGFLKEQTQQSSSSLDEKGNAPATARTPERAIKHPQRWSTHPFDKDNLICPWLLKYSSYFDGLSFYKYRLSLTDTSSTLLDNPSPHHWFRKKMSNKKNHYLCLQKKKELDFGLAKQLKC